MWTAGTIKYYTLIFILEILCGSLSLLILDYEFPTFKNFLNTLAKAYITSCIVRFWVFPTFNFKNCIYNVPIQFNSQLPPPFFPPSLLPSLPPSFSLLPDYMILKDKTEIQFEKFPDGELSPSIFIRPTLVGRWAFPLPKLFI